MITRQEYMTALTVVETFHRQVEEIVSRKVQVREFIQTARLSTRVRNILAALMRLQGEDILLEDINEFDFQRMRNAGVSSWREFTEKRDKYLNDRLYP